MPRPVRGVILLADDGFEADYVSKTLRARGHEVRGPFTDLADALQVVASEPAIGAAVVGRRWDGDTTDVLLAALEARDIGYLLLAPTRRADETSAPLLADPFASYQVADWVEEICPIGTYSGTGPATEAISAATRKV